MKSGWIVVAAAVVGALLATAVWSLLPTHHAKTTSGTARALTVRASFTPSVVEFADTVNATVEVTVDREAVRPETVHVLYGLSPLTMLGSAVEHRVTRGRTTVVSFALRAACLSAPCVAASGRREVTPSPVQVDAERRDGGRVRVSATWAPLAVAGRVSAADVAAARPPFRVNAAAPPVTYRIAPSTLALLLEIAAALLVAGGFALGAAAVLRGSRARRAIHARPDALRDALLLARAARARPEPDRRTALGLVARLLGPRDRRLARAAGDLAWSRPAPTPERLTDLLDDVEREVRT